MAAFQVFLYGRFWVFTEADDVWDRQRRWELKRDALFEALNMMAAVEDALSALHAVYMTDKESGSERPEERSKAYQSLITCERS